MEQLTVGFQLLVAIAILMQFTGAILREKSDWLVIQFLGWVINAFAVWLAVSALDAYVAVWPAILMGFAGFSLAKFLDKLHIIINGTDIAIIFISCFLSTTPIPLGSLIIFSCILVLIRLFSNFLIDKIPNRVFKKILVVCLFSCIVFGVLMSYNIYTRLFKNPVSMPILRPRNLINIGITAPLVGQRIVLNTGGVVWYDKPSGHGPFPGAVIFHGANSSGSNQPAIIILRRALLNAGFAVLSVDHMGYGDSPLPPKNAGVESWDPLPTELATLEFLRSKQDVDTIFLIGHSMGVTEVLRVLAVDLNIAGAVLFGGALHDPPSKLSDYWYERFHTDRNLSYRISRERVINIMAKFYDDYEVLQSLTVEHSPILFAQFGKEWENVIEKRGELYGLIPGTKSIWNIPGSNHYFNTHTIGIIPKMFIGDTRIMRVLILRFKLLASQSLEASKK